MSKHAKEAIEYVKLKDRPELKVHYSLIKAKAVVLG